MIRNLTQIFFRKGMKQGGFFTSMQSKFSKNRMMFQQRKQYVFFQCPKCNKNLRLPKNKGKLQVKCPVCGFAFFKKT
jgi:predicted RNA-binding Zn-ribbon protein involved in translation (DUF1610 family)